MPNTIDTVRAKVLAEFGRRIGPENYEISEYHSIVEGTDTLLDESNYPESSYEIDGEKVKDFISSALDQQVAAIVEKLEGLKKVHKVFECNGAHGGRGCYESWCDMETCTSIEALEMKANNAALTHLHSFISTKKEEQDEN